MKCSQDIKKHLLLDLIPFWFGMADLDNGGFYSRMDFNHNIDVTADKGCILNSRILYFFSSVYNLTKEGELSENDFLKYDYTSSEVMQAAHHAYEFLKTYFYDEVDGGVYWTVSVDGTPVDKTKHVYNMAFTLNALSAYYQSTGREEVLGIAYDIYATIEQCKDEDGYFEAFNNGFQFEHNWKLSEQSIVPDRTTNSLIHILEAYTNFYRVTGDEEVRTQIVNVLNLFSKNVYDTSTNSLKLFFDFDNNSLSDIDSFGHDIMFSWDIIKTLEVLDDEELSAQFMPMALSLAEGVYNEAFDGGSVAFEKQNGYFDESRVWWVQAEAVLGFFYAYLKTQDVRFLEATVANWLFIWDHQIDRRRRPSTWYPTVTKDGKPVLEDALVDEWKCPYHAGRMCMEIVKYLDEIEDLF